MSIIGKILYFFGSLIFAAAFGIVASLIFAGAGGEYALIAGLIAFIGTLVAARINYNILNRDKIAATKNRIKSQDEIQAVRDKIDNLAEKVKHIHSSIDSLKTMEQDAKTSNMIEQLNKFLAGIHQYHDSYCAILIRLEFQKMAKRISAKDVSQVDMKRIFKDIDADVKKIEKLYEELRATVKKGKVGKDEKAGFFGEYKNKIRDLKHKMVALQATIIMSDTSPLNEVVALLHQFDDDPQSGGAIANLNDEYDKFIAEMEVSGL
ncbi:MAG: hypothetical protein FWG66_02470 [Spirochaetes bacterium]|nr:hypothetical protein [Spirochaetota bacterium]